MTRSIWAFAATYLVCTSASPARTHAPPEQRNNTHLVVLLLIDALRPDHVGAYGYDRPTTPHLDRLAAAGTRYLRAYTNAPWTRPSTATFLTGMNASRHRTETSSSVLPPSIATIAQRLRKAGYATGGFTANGNGGSLAGLQRGFDTFEDPTNTYTRAKRGKTYNGLPTGPFVVKRALRWLAQTQSAPKRFLFVFLVDPHDPYGAPPRLEKRFLAGFSGTIRRRALWEFDNTYSADERFSLQALYDAGIRHADEALGAFVTGLDALGIRNTTHLFISADHGEGFGEHGFYLHAHHFWDEVVRIPLVAVGPDFPRGTDARLTQALDVSATILELAGLDAPDLPGHSLLQQPLAQTHVVSEYNEFGIHRQAITDDRYKVIWQRPANVAWYMRAVKKRAYFPSVSFTDEVIHVYDLQRDPGETTNLAANSPPRAQSLLRELRDFVATSAALAIPEHAK